MSDNKSIDARIKEIDERTEYLEEAFQQMRKMKMGNGVYGLGNGIPAQEVISNELKALKAEKDELVAKGNKVK